MKLYANYRVRVKPDMITFIKRSLEGKGQILVSVGQELSPEEIIGKSFVSGGFRNIKLDTLLEVNPKDAQKYLQKKIGQTVYKGELLAFKEEGLWRDKKIVTAPGDCIIEAYNSTTGELRLKSLPKIIDLPAAVFGVVEKVDPIRGQILIRSQVTQIFGLLGSGKIRDGILRVLSSKNGLVNASQIKPDLAERIVVGGSLIYDGALPAMLNAGVHGVITGGINVKDFQSMAGRGLHFAHKLASDVGISVLVTEGFGSIPIGDDILEFLKKYDGRFVILDGNGTKLSLPAFDGSSMIRIKKTVLPNLPKGLLIESMNEPEAFEISVGQRARVITPPFMGTQGQIVSIDQTPTMLESGIRAFLLTLETKSRKIKVPYSNIEII